MCNSWELDAAPIQIVESWDLNAMKVRVVESWDLNAMKVRVVEVPLGIYGGGRHKESIIEKIWYWFLALLTTALGGFLVFGGLLFGTLLWNSSLWSQDYDTKGKLVGVALDIVFGLPFLWGGVAFIRNRTKGK